jgi:hypothetical protein
MKSPLTPEQLAALKPLLEEIKDSLREQMVRNDSPWTDREGAAAYCCCTKWAIDQAASRGEIKRRYGTGSHPLFKKSGGVGSLDAWIEGKRVNADVTGVEALQKALVGA